MNDVIFHLQPNGELMELTSHPYDSEVLLQSLLANYPQLISKVFPDEKEFKNWLLISREIPIPSEEEESGRRFSIDHLFLDVDGIPTSIEVKRSSDTRIRREVVGKMMDYAANAVVYWPIEVIKQIFWDTCRDKGLDADEVLNEFLSEDYDVDSFWLAVKTNLHAGRIRKVFVADIIPSELRRIVEFLNSQMDPAEVLAVEIQQYTGGETKSLVPRVYGQTAEAQRKKAGERKTRKWNEATFFAELSDNRPIEIESIARGFLKFAKQVTGRNVDWGTGKERGSFTGRLIIDNIRYSVFSVYTTGEITLNFGWNYYRFGEKKAIHLKNIVNEKLSLSLEDNIWMKGYPLLDLKNYIDNDGDDLKALIEKFVDEMKSHKPE